MNRTPSRPTRRTFPLILLACAVGFVLAARGRRGAGPACAPCVLLGDPAACLAGQDATGGKDRGLPLAAGRRGIGEDPRGEE